ncbi:hypothetical protein SNEBB_000122 [Seison nebaliae]|nr:hypothetical protein SNEBB_000122 [Seison nebaliae]
MLEASWIFMKIIISLFMVTGNEIKFIISHLPESNILTVSRNFYLEISNHKYGIISFDENMQPAVSTNCKNYIGEKNSVFDLSLCHPITLAIIVGGNRKRLTHHFYNLTLRTNSTPPTVQTLTRNSSHYFHNDLSSDKYHKIRLTVYKESFYYEAKKKYKEDLTHNFEDKKFALGYSMWFNTLGPSDKFKIYDKCGYCEEYDQGICCNDDLPTIAYSWKGTVYYPNLEMGTSVMIEGVGY